MFETLVSAWGLCLPVNSSLDSALELTAALNGAALSSGLAVDEVFHKPEEAVKATYKILFKEIQ